MWGWAICLLVAAVQRRSLTPSKSFNQLRGVSQLIQTKTSYFGKCGSATKSWWCTITRYVCSGGVLLDCLTQVERWRHSVSDVVEYVTTEKVTRIYFKHASCIHTPVGNSNTLSLYRLITSYFEAFFLRERMNISDSLHKLRISHRISFSHYKQNTRVSQI
jgi:hypothetical protein